MSSRKSHGSGEARAGTSELTYREALRQLLPGFDWTQKFPPREPYWKAGCRPPDHLAIDDCIANLIEVRDSGNRQKCALRSADTLMKDFVADPYLVAREFVARGVEAGRQAEARVRTAKTRKASLTREAEWHERRLRTVEELGSAPRGETVPPLDGTDHGEADPAEAEIETLRAALVARCRAQAQAKRADLARQAVPAANVWLEAFLHEIGEAWHLLTGRLPSSSSDPFLDFAAAALKSVTSASSEDFSYSIRKVAETASRSPTRRFDRISKPDLDLDLRLSALTGGLIYNDERATTFVRDPLPPWSGQIYKRNAAYMRTVRSAADSVRLSQSAEERSAALGAVRVLLAGAPPKIKADLEQQLQDEGVI